MHLMIPKPKTLHFIAARRNPLASYAPSIHHFLKLYNNDGVDSIGSDHAAFQLGVERRRIYDIVNVLESVGDLTLESKCGGLIKVAKYY